ncbi:MAG: hypothetical protein JW840_09505 [Candidatus Thermoplasmatota archaeon]|nr:hypothetical protein [Candidatus Thermoplasmatota archaeon]
MKIIIRSDVGLATPVTIDCEPTDAIGTLLNKACADQGITDSNGLCLSYKGRPLENNQRVKDVGIKDADTLEIVPSYRIVGAYPTSSFSFSFGKKNELPEHIKKRLAWEARIIRVRHLPLAMDLNDPLNWTAKVAGTGLWRGQSSTVEIKLSRKYPQKMPHIIWTTSLSPVHPNIFPDTTGWVCLSTLNDESWRPTRTLASIYDDLVYVMDHPHWHEWQQRPAMSRNFYKDDQGSGWMERVIRSLRRPVP